jgi:hypothetical protein
MALANQTIVLQGDLAGRHLEKLSSAASKPGYALEMDADGKLKPHSVRGGKGRRIFAKEDYLRGGLITGVLQDATTYYGSAETVLAHEARSGEKINTVLMLGENVAVGDYAISYGNGRMAKAASAFLANNLAASTTLGASSAAELTFSNGTVTIPANTLKVADVLRIRGHGTYPATNSTDTATVKVKIGSAAILTSPAVDVANADIFVFDATLVIRTIGATGTCIGSGFINVGVPTTATTRASHVVSTTIDTTGALSLTVTNTFSVSDAGNGTILQSLIVEHVKAGSSVISPDGAGEIWGQFEEAVNAASADAFCAMTVI